MIALDPIIIPRLFQRELPVFNIGTNEGKHAVRVAGRIAAIGRRVNGRMCSTADSRRLDHAHPWTTS